MRYLILSSWLIINIAYDIYTIRQMNSFFDFSAKALRGNKEISMSDYEGKVIIVVNTASKCGFAPQLEGLESLYKKYHKQGLVILGFPCNQFGRQEPGDNASIEEGCVLNYGVTFQMFSKIDVNGSNAHPLFVYLKSKLKGTLTDAIKWNFTKFIIDRNGNPVKRFSSLTTPSKIESFLLENGFVK